ncbi:hypothetical protein HYE59_06145 [Aggregatibacter actinomycetemcomitans]|uniref:hypothetical protein n=1 Tax=Aggregatibacter actinomycetemcomitans TaxID=714 RepID=UPI00197C7D87|nr:hypothetical protein [Aggregatibacter actinomycetemcomitans]MBN6077120.1 hypothetical protein [Aggregatibacter actinomycetemcomitans]
MEDWHLCQLDKMTRIFLYILSGLCMISCSDFNKINVLQDEYLDSAKLGKYYSYVVNVPKKSVIPDSFSIKMEPNNVGLTWETGTYNTSMPIKARDYNNITISGKPNVAGEIYIDFSWSTYGSMVYSPKAYKKRYILKVEE